MKMTSAEYAIQQANKDIDLYRWQLNRIAKGEVKLIGDVARKVSCERGIIEKLDLIKHCEAK